MPAPSKYATWPPSPVPRIWRKPIGGFLKFAQEFEKRFVGRGGDGDREIIGTHAIARQRLSLLPPEILTCAGEASIVIRSARRRRRELSAATLAVSSLRCPASLETPGLALRRFASSFACKTRADHPWSARSPHAAHPWQARSAGKGSIGPFAYAASPLRSRHLCILHIRIRNVEYGLDNRIFRIRFIPRPGIIFWWRIVN